MNKNKFAQALGSLGGKARAKKLSEERKKEISRLGVCARRESLLFTRRILENYRYLEAVRTLSPEIKTLSRQHFNGKLPGIYA